MPWLLSLVERIPGMGKWASSVLERTANREASVGLVVNELEQNAEAVSTGRSVSDLKEELRFSAWDANAQAVMVATRKRPDVEREVKDAYNALQRTASRGASPPSVDSILSAAAALNELVK